MSQMVALCTPLSITVSDWAIHTLLQFNIATEPASWLIAMHLPLFQHARLEAL